MDETLRDVTNKRTNDNQTEPDVAPSKRRQSNIDLIARLQSRITTTTLPRLLNIHHRYIPLIQAENEQLRAAQQKPTVSDSLSTTRLMAALERENEQLQLEMQQLKTAQREKMARLDSQLAIIGNEPAAKKLIDQIQSLGHQLKESNRDKMRREEEYKERDQLRLNEIDMLKGTIEEMNQQQQHQVTMEDEVEVMKTQLLNLQQMLDQSIMEKSLLEAGKAQLVNGETQTEPEPTVDSFFRDLTLTANNQPSRADLEVLLNEATTMAETFKKERDALKEQYNEALEEMAFMNDEKQCHNEAVDDLNKENSSLKEQLLSLSSNTANNVSMDQIASLKAEIVDLKEKLASQSDAQNLESMLIQSQKSEKVTQLKLDMVHEELKQSQESLAEVNQKVTEIQEEMNEQKVQHKRSADQWKQIIADLQKELNAAIYGQNGGAGRLEHSTEEKQQQQQQQLIDVAVQTASDLIEAIIQTDSIEQASKDVQTSQVDEVKTKLSKSEMEELGIEDDSALNSTLKDENERLRNELTNQAARLERLLVERDTLQTDCESLAATADKLKHDLLRQNAQLAEAEANAVELGTVRQYLAETEAARASLLEKAEKNERFLNEIKPEYERLKDEYDALTEEHARHQAQVNLAEAARKTALIELDEKTRALNMIEQRKAAGDEELANLRVRFNEEHNKHQSLARQYLTLKNESNVTLKQKLRKYYDLYQAELKRPCPHCHTARATTT